MTNLCQVIHIDKTDSVSASSENANFPASRLLDNYAARKWKALDGVHSASLTIQSGGTINAIMIANTNAESATISIGDPNTAALGDGDVFGGGDAWASPSYPSITYSVLAGDNSNSIWFEFASSFTGGGAMIVIQLTAPAGETLFAGILRVGETEDFRAPNYGMKCGLVDYAVSRDLPNGAFYYRKRTTGRSYTFQVLETQANAKSLIYTIARQYGRVPKAWRIVSGDDDYIVFGRLDMPTVSVDYPRHSLVELNITESPT